jgi:enhancer of polycomb-like protein
MTTRGAGQRFRQRKLSVKQNLQIVREDELAEPLDDEALRHIPKFDTGVEKGEETVRPSLDFHRELHRRSRDAWRWC